MAEPDLLVTKFTIPPVRSALLRRPHLLALLDQSTSVPLTLISAPAGFGKTTLLSAWAGQCTSQVAWFMLDEQDNDPARFWAYVIAALRKAGAAVGETTLAMLHSPQPATLSSALTVLLNELAAQAKDTALILDDYQLIREAAIHESLQFVLAHLPANLHLLLGTRADPQLPLARLRARGQVIEIREGDLRLREEEAAGFFSKVMGLSLTPEEVARLEQRTEGWIAGLQLAALSLRKHTDVSTFLRNFSGSQRFLLEYIQEEILAPLPQAQERFLLHTSVLTRMNAEICQALTGELASQQMLEELERANLFLISLDEEQSWYRLHTLLREVLLTRLQVKEPEEFRRLHREAALWYQRQDWPHEAIPHALATQDFMFVADLLEGWVERLYLRGEFKTLLSWVKMLPEDVLRAHPFLATSYIMTFNMLFPFSHQMPEERVYTRRLQEAMEQLMQHPTTLNPQKQELLLQRMRILRGWNLLTRALSDGETERLEGTLELLKDQCLDDGLMWRLQAEGSTAVAARLLGNFPLMISLIEEGRKTWMAENRYLQVQYLWGLIAAYIALGQLRQAQDRCEVLQQLIATLGIQAPLAAYPDLFRAQLAYAGNQLEVAKSAALSAIEKTGPLQFMDILMGAYEVRVRCYLAEGDLAAARQALQEMENAHRLDSIPLFRPWIESLQVQLWLAQGDLARAGDWAAHTSYLHGQKFYSSRESAYLAHTRVYLAQKKYSLALERLAALQSSAEQFSRMGSVISILALKVNALQASGADEEAQQMLLRLLSLAEPEGFIRVFLDAGEPMQQALQAFLKTTHTPQNDSPISLALIAYARTVLTAFGQESAQVVLEEMSVPSSKSPSLQTAQPPLEVLTPREQQVLLLLAQGASNREIADELVVSLATAKKHVASILSKLGAENRTQAIAHARSRALL
ncbi:hypothetical protein EPA93_13330 [Ktedonosporobacter rubrisoli]|uniref:HTH luxR-type domain-containing protein n=1 Tax=Ktedonosporobacter rubrisoli TaxID=2509675 RepID=A0A4P6JPD3_KTERU|nr:LuxR C-terminal-related transcriptional regulator [Ktedonosporobacter rubrisoli]QBD76932.1 hypothetical protein EPA93_13330 [Ktedonosporobacter rubrisoli]